MATYKKPTRTTRVAKVVRQAMRQVASSRSRLNAMNKELGYADVASTTYGMSTTGSIALLNTVAQGAATNQRVGKKWKMTSLQFRGLAYASTAGVVNDVAFLIVYDKRPTGSLPAVTDILNTANALSQNKDDNVPSRFTILKRQHFMLIGNTTTPATGEEAKDVDFYLKLNHPVVNKAVGTGAIGDIEEGALYLVTVGNNAAGVTSATMEGTFRVRFIDT